MTAGSCCWPASRGSASRASPRSSRARAHADGAVVLYGRFDETGAGRLPAGDGDAARLVGRRGARLAPRASGSARARPTLPRCCPSSARRSAPTAVPATALNEAGTERQRLFDALAALLAELAGGAPLLLVFDDLHWADGPTVQLLRHLVRAPQPRRVLFLGTYRDAELEDGHPLPELIDVAAARGHAHATWSSTASSASEVGELMQAHGVGAPLFRPRRRRCTARPRATRSSSRRSCATCATRRAGSRAASTSRRRGCRRACARSPSRRLRRLPSSAREAVEVASVIGREFDFGAARGARRR